MYAEERQRAIADEVLRRARVSVTDLAQRYDVTTETIRRDLAALDRSGAVRRVHGGAVSAASTPRTERGIGAREGVMSEEKDRIAKAAFDYLPPAGGSVALDAGTTTGRLAGLLPPERSLTVVTNSVPIAATVGPVEKFELIMLGGRVRGLTQAAVGARALAGLDRLTADVAFLGTNAITAENGLSTPDQEEADVKRAMVSHADLVVVLADSTKLGHDALVRFAEPESVDVLITDAAADREVVEQLQEAGIEVVQA